MKYSIYCVLTWVFVNEVEQKECIDGSVSLLVMLMNGYVNTKGNNSMLVFNFQNMLLPYSIYSVTLLSL